MWKIIAMALSMLIASASLTHAQVLSPDEASGCILVNQLTGQPFPIADSTVYKNRPAMSDFCIANVPLVYAQHLWASGHEEETLPDRNRIIARAESYNHDGVRIIIDLELWISEWRGYDVADYIGHYTTVHNWFKSAAPNVPIGFYDVIPKRHYWPAQSDPNSSDYTNWQNANNVLFPIGDAVDVCHPSLYTFYDDQAGWVRFAKAMIAECRRIAPGKPVIPVIWPQYHPSNSDLKYQYISRTYWRKQLDVLREHADGISIWGGWQGGTLSWNDSFPWWQETQNFIADGFTQTTAGDPLPDPEPDPDPDPDPQALEISDVSVEPVSDTTVDVSFSMNPSATGQTDYGTSESLGTVHGPETNHLSFHRQRIENLTPGTTYFFKISGTTAQGAFAESDLMSFTTASSEPTPEPEPEPDPDPTPTPRLDALETAIDEINQRLDDVDAALQKGRKARKDAGEALTQ
jgi:hypothetical protein